MIRATASVAPASHEPEPIHPRFLGAYTHRVDLHGYVRAGIGPTVTGRGLVTPIFFVQVVVELRGAVDEALERGVLPSADGELLAELGVKRLPESTDKIGVIVSSERADGFKLRRKVRESPRSLLEFIDGVPGRLLRRDDAKAGFERFLALGPGCPRHLISLIDLLKIRDRPLAHRTVHER